MERDIVVLQSASPYCVRETPCSYNRFYCRFSLLFCLHLPCYPANLSVACEIHVLWHFLSLSAPANIHFASHLIAVTRSKDHSSQCFNHGISPGQGLLIYNTFYKNKSESNRQQWQTQVRSDVWAETPLVYMRLLLCLQPAHRPKKLSLPSSHCILHSMSCKLSMVMMTEFYLTITEHGLVSVVVLFCSTSICSILWASVRDFLTTYLLRQSTNDL